MRKRVLITGGSGILAVNWAITMRDRHQIILGLHSRNISLRNVHSSKISIESGENFTSELNLINPDIVIHTAGLTNIETCELKPNLAHDINVKLAGNVAYACKKLAIPLVHISTDHIFSGSDSFSGETVKYAPKNVYASTKAEAEVRILDVCPEALIIRTNFFAWGPSYRRSFSDLIIDSLRVGKKITLFEDAFYTPILAESVAYIVHELIEKNANGIFNIVGDDRISKLEFGYKVAKHFDLESNLILPGYLNMHSALVIRPLDMSLSNRKTIELLGRKLGGVDEHITKLRKQEEIGIAKELQNI